MMLLIVGVLFSFAGCSDPLRPVGMNELEDRDPMVRIRAIKWAGDNKVTDAVPILVDRLQEQDESVRFFAISSLKQISGTDHGFDYKADPASRAQAVQRWRDSLKQSTPPANTN